MRKSLFLALLFAFVLPFTAPKAQAQINFLPYLGYNIDAEALLVGVGAELDAPFAFGDLALAARPTIEYIFVDDGGLGDEVSTTALQINGDIIARLDAENFQPYAGAGLAISYFSFDADCDGDPVCESILDNASSTDIGINLIGGLEFGAVGFGTPFVQGRLTLADGSAISILGGLLIPLGAE